MSAWLLATFLVDFANLSRIPPQNIQADNDRIPQNPDTHLPPKQMEHLR
jgi:hypothetical protein